MEEYKLTPLFAAQNQSGTLERVRRSLLLVHESYHAWRRGRREVQGGTPMTLINSAVVRHGFCWLTHVASFRQFGHGQS